MSAVNVVQKRAVTARIFSDGINKWFYIFCVIASVRGLNCHTVLEYPLILFKLCSIH
jgi:hypothetical protein